jgi:hypothetical protein
MMSEPQIPDSGQLPEIERLTQELKLLRDRRGLTPAALERAPTIVAMLGALDAQQAQEQLVGLIGELGDDERVRALKVDYRLDLDVLAPGILPDERGWVGHRRNAHHRAKGVKSPKRLKRYSDEIVDELAIMLAQGRVGSFTPALWPRWSMVGRNTSSLTKWLAAVTGQASACIPSTSGIA